MRHKHFKPILFILCLVAASGIAMAYTNRLDSSGGGPGPVPGGGGANSSGIVSLSGHLVQNKILQGSDGNVTLSLVLRAEDIEVPGREEGRSVDMVIVIDRSGSMKGRKIADARQAVLKLLSGLTEADRFALVTYSDGVEKYSGLLHMTAENRNRIRSAVGRLRASGGTNLGAGLKAGIDTLVAGGRIGNTGKVILISDGLANKGITDPAALGSIAAIAIEKEFSVSTAGVGSEFNEQLMTRIADRGTGNYYYLENPDAFAEVFQREFHLARAAAATSVAVRVPVSSGISLVDASGYPITTRGGYAVFYPGDLRSGQTRKLFLTLRVPTGRTGTFDIGQIDVQYLHGGQAMAANFSKPLQISCVKSKKEVFSSIDREKWEEKVLKEDYNRLKQEVACDIKEGEQKKALDRIKSYFTRQKAANAVVGSGKVEESLDKDIGELKGLVRDTFEGSPASVSQKQKLNSKSLQYEGYRGRRAAQ